MTVKYVIISHEHYISFLLFFVPVTDGQDNVVFTEEVDMSRPCLDTIMNPLWCAAKEKESRGERREEGGGQEGEEMKEKIGRRKKLMVTWVLYCSVLLPPLT